MDSHTGKWPVRHLAVCWAEPGRPEPFLSAQDLFQECPRRVPHARKSSPHHLLCAWQGGGPTGTPSHTHLPLPYSDTHTQPPWLRTRNKCDLLCVSQLISSRAKIWAQVPLRPKSRELNVMDESLGSGARVSGLESWLCRPIYL